MARLVTSLSGRSPRRRRRGNRLLFVSPEASTHRHKHKSERNLLVIQRAKPGGRGNGSM